MSDELVDVVDEEDLVVDTVPRALMRSANLRHRAVFVLVRSTRGEVLIHRRSDTKDVWPGQWDLAIGGVVASGESYDAAAVRELAEEIGVTVEAGVLEPLGGGRFEDDAVRLVGHVYRLVHDGPFAFRDGEVVEACFVGLAELEARLAREPFLPDSRALVLPWLGLGEP